MAHEFSKEALVPQFQDNFDFSRCRSQLLGQQVGVWSNLWCPPALAPQGPLPDFGPVPRLPPIAPQDIRATARSFKTRTCAVGGIHSLHFAVMSDDALRMLLNILHACERAGVLPDDMSSLAVVLIPKVPTGCRPIGLFQASYRVYSRYRHGIVDAWEQEFASQTFFTAGKQKGALNAMWKHGFRAEVSNARDNLFCAVLADIEKCYEYVRHADLILQAQKHSYPLAILRLSLQAYRSPRRVQLHGIVSNPIFAIDSRYYCGIFTCDF